METISNILIIGVTFAYISAIIIYLCNFIIKIPLLKNLGSNIIRITLVLHTISIILRWFASYQLGHGHAPFSNLFESLIFFSWALTTVYLIIEWQTSLKQLSIFALPLPILSLLYALSKDSNIHPLLPALKSNWLIIHVITCFIGYASFGISFALSIMYLVTSNTSTTTNRKELISILDTLIYKTVVIGFFLLSIGIITGAIWANSAWSTYWTWDPKETWSFITWLIYAALLHSRFLRGWQGRHIAIFSIIGFFCVLFTYFGVNYLGGLHSYTNN